MTYFKKALFTGAFFVSALIFSLWSIPSFASPANCQPSQRTENVRVKWVYDGDTLLLRDGRKVRIIGIDTPEVPHRGKRGEPLGPQATEALRELLAKHNYRISILPGKEKHDKYKRLLAHVFLPDSTNVSQWSLEHGWSSLLLIPPNIQYLKCYQQAQLHAQNRRLKIWSLAEYQVKDIDLISRKKTGYIRLRATILKSWYRKKTLTIKLASNIYIKIKGHDLDFFKKLKHARLKNRQILVTGVLRKYGKNRYIRVRHPAYLQILE
jgi:endonuclease YncB( thermonuclease family)